MRRSVSLSFCTGLCLVAGILGCVGGYLAGKNSGDQVETARTKRIKVRGTDPGDGTRNAGVAARPGGRPEHLTAASDSLRGESSGSEYAKRLREAVAMGEPLAEASLIQTLQTMSPEDGTATYAFLLDLLDLKKGGRGFNVDRIWHLYWRRYGTVDLTGALAAADKDESSYNQKDRVRKHIYLGWGNENPQVAMARLSSDESLPERDRGIESLSGEWAGRDPNAAASWSLAHLSGHNLATALGAIQWGTVRWAGTQPGGYASAVDLWRALPPSPEADAASEALAVALAQNSFATLDDRVLAARAIENRGLSQPSLLEAVARDYAATDRLQEGLELLTSMTPPEGSDNYAGVARLIRSWNAKDPAATATWISAQEGKPWFQSVSQGVIQR